MRGRKPKPTALKLLQGSRGHRRLNENEPQPTLGVGEPPADLPKAALEEWHRLGPELELMGVLTSVDRHAFIAYVRAWARYVEADAACRRRGEVVKNPSGRLAQNPMRAIANTALRQCREFQIEFGMTPSSRARISAKPRKSVSTESASRRKRFFGALSRNA